MKNYVGCKIIQARSTTLAEYKKIKYGSEAKINDGDENIECYLVVYPPIGDEPDPYISMSPKAVFEKAYREIDNTEISLIIGLDAKDNEETKTSEK